MQNTVFKKIQSQQRQRVALMTQQTLYGYMDIWVILFKNASTPIQITFYRMR